MLQNMILLAYVIFLILNKIEYFENKMGLFVFTIIILIPEVKQNWESLKTLFGFNEDIAFSFEDFQNFVELTGYTMQIVYTYHILR